MLRRGKTERVEGGTLYLWDESHGIGTGRFITYRLRGIPDLVLCWFFDYGRGLYGMVGGYLFFAGSVGMKHWIPLLFCVVHIRCLDDFNEDEIYR